MRQRLALAHRAITSGEKYTVPRRLRFRIKERTMINNNGEQILVADDDPMSRRLLLRTLSAAGFLCRESADGTEALEMLHAEICLRSSCSISTCRD